jgi:hypothetical protein
MTTQTAFDIQAGHKFFAAQCFNQTWDLIDKAERMPEEDEQMLLCALASLYHWAQREDCTRQNLSVGHWQAARVYALLGQAENARHHGGRSLEFSQGEGPFYIGYAYEALARAEAVAGDGVKRDEYLVEARRQANLVPEAEARQMLLDDLATIR